MVPLFAGIDPRDLGPRIYEYDPVGGRYRATEHAASGSGSLAARATLKRLFDPEASLEEAAGTALEALFDAAEEDSATGGPDLIRRIYPIVAVIEPDTGYRELPDDELRQKLSESKEELFNLRFQIVTGQLDDPRRIKTVKREIARVLTVLREREIAAAREIEA